VPAADRQHDRREIALPIRVVLGQSTLEGTSVDISVGGVRALLPSDLPFGTKVKVHLRLPAVAEELAIDAESRWSRAEAGGFSVGLQFQRVRARETWALNQLMRGR